MSIEFSGAGISPDQIKSEHAESSNSTETEKNLNAVREVIRADNEQSTQSKLTAEEIAETAEAFAEVAQNMNRDLRFSVTNEYERPIIRVIDRDSGETIRQIPSEEIVELAVKLRELNANEHVIDSATGLLIDSRV